MEVIDALCPEACRSAFAFEGDVLRLIAAMSRCFKSEHVRAFDIYLEIMRKVAIWIREAKATLLVGR